MFKRLLSRFRRIPQDHSIAAPLETLENRLLLAAAPVPGPRVLSVFADNRGQVVLTVDKSLAPQNHHAKRRTGHHQRRERNGSRPGHGCL